LSRSRFAFNCLFVFVTNSEHPHCPKDNSDYNYFMARGWESKSVEAQQAEASDKSSHNRPPMSAEEAARWREKESLRLARQRVLQQLEASTNPRHRKTLQASLADLDEKLSRLKL
jgi:hypothetical protein